MENGRRPDDWRMHFELTRMQLKGELARIISEAEAKIYSQAVNQADYNDMILRLSNILERFPAAPLINIWGNYSAAQPYQIDQGGYPTQQEQGSNLQGLASMSGTAHYVPGSYLTQQEGGSGLASMSGTAHYVPGSYLTQQERGSNLQGLAGMFGTAHFVPVHDTGPSQTQQEGINLPDLGIMSGTVSGGPAGEMPTILPADDVSWEPFMYNLFQVITCEWLKEQETFLQQLMSGAKCELLECTKDAFTHHYPDERSLFEVWKNLIMGYGSQLMDLKKEFSGPHIGIICTCNDEQEMYGKALTLDKKLFCHLAILQVIRLAPPEKWRDAIYNFQQSVPLFIEEGKKEIAEMKLFLEQQNPKHKRRQRRKKKSNSNITIK